MFIRKEMFFFVKEGVSGVGAFGQSGAGKDDKLGRNGVFRTFHSIKCNCKWLKSTTCCCLMKRKL